MRSRTRIPFAAGVALFTALAAVVVATVSLAPHDEAEGPSCLVCKAGSQPFETSVSQVGSAPSLEAPTYVAAIFPDHAPPELARVRSPRAPPR
jgi:hypothetical protein